MENENNAAESANDESFSEELTTDEQAYFDNGGIEEGQPESNAGEAEKAEAKEPAAEAAAESEGEKPNEPEKQSMVPHQALHAEREEKKRFKAELETAKQRLDQLTEVVQAQHQEPEYQPDPDADPLGNIAYLNEQMSAMRQQQVEQQQQAAYENQVQEVVGNVVLQLQEANEADPTVQEAYNHMSESLRQEAKAGGYDDRQASIWAQQTAREHALLIAQNGVNPADYIKQMAAAKGWKPQAQETEQQADSIGDKIDKANENMGRHKSLSDAEGGAAASKVDILSMSDEEYGTWLSQVGESGWQKEVMG